MDSNSWDKKRKKKRRNTADNRDDGHENKDTTQRRKQMHSQPVGWEKRNKEKKSLLPILF